MTEFSSVVSFVNNTGLIVTVLTQFHSMRGNICLNIR